jgi:hypothetical protein
MSLRDGVARKAVLKRRFVNRQRGALTDLRKDLTNKTLERNKQTTAKYNNNLTLDGRVSPEYTSDQPLRLRSTTANASGQCSTATLVREASPASDSRRAFHGALEGKTRAGVSVMRNIASEPRHTARTPRCDIAELDCPRSLAGLCSSGKEKNRKPGGRKRRKERRMRTRDISERTTTTHTHTHTSISQRWTASGTMTGMARLPDGLHSRRRTVQTRNRSRRQKLSLSLSLSLSRSFCLCTHSAMREAPSSGRRGDG